MVNVCANKEATRFCYLEPVCRYVLTANDVGTARGNR